MNREKVPTKTGSLLQQSLTAAAAEGETIDWDEWGACPLAFPMFQQVERDAQGQERMVKTHRQVPYKFLKDLKEAVSKYGAGSAFVRKLVGSSVSVSVWLPGDWDEIMQACLEATAYVAYRAYLQRLARRASDAVHPNDTAAADLMTNQITGFGDWSSSDAQLQMPDEVLKQVQVCNMEALEKLGVKEKGRLSALKQRRHETPLKFMTRVQETIYAKYGRGDMATELIIQLFREGLQGPDRGLLATLPANPTVAEIVDKCLDVEDNTDPKLVASLQKALTLAPVATGGVCYNCGREGHFRRSCPKLKGGGMRCFNCNGSGHIAKHCRKGKGQGQRKPQGNGGAGPRSEGRCPRSLNPRANPFRPQPQ